MVSEHLQEIYQSIQTPTPFPVPSNDPLYQAWKASVSAKPNTFMEKLAAIKALPASRNKVIFYAVMFLISGLAVWFFSVRSQKRFDEANARLTARAVGTIKSVKKATVGRRLIKKAVIEYEYNLQTYSQEFNLEYYSSYQPGDQVRLILDPSLPEASRFDEPITQKPADHIPVGIVFAVLGLIMLIWVLL